MNILFIADEIPDPVRGGGRLRTYNLLKQLATRHKVVLVALMHSPTEAESIAKVGALGVEVIPLLRATRPQRTAWEKVRLHLSPVPHFFVHRPLPEDFGERIAALRARQDFAVVHLDYAHTGPCAAFVQDLPIVLTQHNVQSQVPLTMLMAQPPLERLHAWREALDYCKWRYVETRWSRAADVLVAVSEQEAAFFSRRLPETQVIIVPNGVDVSSFSEIERTPEPATILFTGGMHWQPNIDAMLYFCREIYPTIRAQRPDVRLLIVGAEPRPEVQALASDSSITVTGTVPEVRPYFARATAFVAPLRSGAGTRLKILEAFAARVPVVSTSLGCEGLEVEDGRHLIVADSAPDFAAKVLRILDDSELRARLTRAGHLLVETTYDYAIVVRELEKALELAIRRKGEKNAARMAN